VVVGVVAELEDSIVVGASIGLIEFVGPSGLDERHRFVAANFAVPDSESSALIPHYLDL